MTAHEATKRAIVQLRAGGLTIQTRRPTEPGMGLDAVELVLSFEEEFGIAIPDAAAANMHTPRDVAFFVREERSRLLRPMSESEITRQIKEIVIRHLGIAETDYSEHKRFIEDFGAD